MWKEITECTHLLLDSTDSPQIKVVLFFLKFKDNGNNTNFQRTKEAPSLDLKIMSSSEGHKNKGHEQFQPVP